MRLVHKVALVVFDGKGRDAEEILPVPPFTWVQLKLGLPPYSFHKFFRPKHCLHVVFLLPINRNVLFQNSERLLLHCENQRALLQLETV